MRRYRCFTEGDWSSGDQIVLDEAESRHLAKVLRAEVDQEIEILNGQGQTGLAGIIEISSQKSVRIEILEVQNHTRLGPHLHIACSPVKSSLWEDSFEQAIELGMNEFTPLISEHSIVVWDQKKTAKKLERLEKLARERLKQCEQPYLPKINPPTELKDFLTACAEKESNVWAMQERADKFLPDICEEEMIILIGPEGGWSENEVEMFEKSGVKPMNLGSMILRTETAFLSACATVLALKNKAG